MDNPIVRVGLIGSGIQSSRSPHLHEAEAKASGLLLSYELIDTEGSGIEVLPNLLDKVEAWGFAGVNITHPFKQAVLPLLHELSQDAAAIGAVNTVVFSGGKRIGHNTDSYGFSESFKRGLAGESREKVVMVGAGGAGSAAGYAALELGVRQLTIYDSNRDRAGLLAERLSSRFEGRAAVAVSGLSGVLARADGVIQATPVGMAAHPGMPFAADLLHLGLWVAEIIYFPLETELLRAARSIGCRTLDGLGMAVFQAAEAFRLFTGITPDAERMFGEATNFKNRHE